MFHSSSPNKHIDYEIELVTDDDKEKIINFLQTFYFRDEPLNAYIGLIPNGKQLHKDLENYILKYINNGVNLKAVQEGKLVGVSLNYIYERGWIDREKHFFECEDQKFTVILDFQDYVSKESDPFKAFPGCEKCMSVDILSVDASFRGKGIARELMIKTRDLAKELGCGFMTADCTNHYTTRALKKLGFKLHWSLDYAHYKPNGTVVFKPPPPHLAVTVYTQKID